MLVTKEIELDMGHRVPNHRSKCRNFHGHRYKIEVGVDDKVITRTGDSSEGMVIDYSDLKSIMMREIDEPYDHSFTIWRQDDKVETWRKWALEDKFKVNIISKIPTAENLAEHWFYMMYQPLKDLGIELHHVKVWETPSSTATFRPQYGSDFL